MTLDELSAPRARFETPTRRSPHIATPIPDLSKLRSTGDYAWGVAKKLILNFSGVGLRELTSRFRILLESVLPSAKRAQWPGAPASMSDEEWVDFLAGERAFQGLIAPQMPPADLQRSFVGLSGREALYEALAFCSKLVETASAFGVTVGRSSRVLDFGCGWGRLYRVMLRWCSPANLIGVDIDEKCVNICHDAMPYGTFVKTEVEPPLPFQAGSFEIVYAYSVFSHLAQRGL